MNQLNQITIEGNACRDAEIKNTSTGTAICKISIAVNRFYKSGDKFEKEVSFFDVDCFGEVAKLCGEKVKKGDEIRIHGRMKQNRWEQDGQKRSTVIVIAERVEFGTKPASGGNSTDASATSQNGEPDVEDIPF